jgi:hypothetical protein
VSDGTRVYTEAATRWEPCNAGLAATPANPFAWRCGDGLRALAAGAREQVRRVVEFEQTAVTVRAEA